MSLQDETTYSRSFTEIRLKLPFSKKTWLVFGKSPEKQLRQARLLLAEQPDDVDLRLRLAFVLADQGQNEEALLEWHAATMLLPFDDDVRDDIALSQKNAWSHYIFGLILHNQGMIPQAIAEWDKASNLDAYAFGDLARRQASEARNSGPSVKPL